MGPRELNEALDALEFDFVDTLSVIKCRATMARARTNVDGILLITPRYVGFYGILYGLALKKVINLTDITHMRNIAGDDEDDEITLCTGTSYSACFKNLVGAKRSDIWDAIVDRKKIDFRIIFNNMIATSNNNAVVVEKTEFASATEYKEKALIREKVREERELKRKEELNRIGDNHREKSEDEMREKNREIKELRKQIEMEDMKTKESKEMEAEEKMIREKEKDIKKMKELMEKEEKDKERQREEEEMKIKEKEKEIEEMKREEREREERERTEEEERILKEKEKDIEELKKQMEKEREEEEEERKINETEKVIAEMNNEGRKEEVEEESERKVEISSSSSSSSTATAVHDTMDVQIKYRGEEEVGGNQSDYTEIPDSGNVNTDDTDILASVPSEGPKIVGGKLVIETEADIAAVMIDVIHEIFYNPKFGLWQSYDKTFLADKKPDILAKGLPGWDAPEHSNERAEARYHINFAKNEEISNLVNGEFANNAVEEVYEIMSALVKSVKKKHCKTAVKNHIRLHLYRLLYGSEDADILL
eukprot:c14099_g1_i1.p1 GENE.c14099_g1_i1~~c14099_g1_i1.p1  ORF type:complete len:538 (-),score=35.03 c14099_g1_i1:12-1625(-)